MLCELIELADGAGHVITVADFGGAREHGARFSSGDAGRAVHALGELIESVRFSLPVAQTFPLAGVAEAHRVSEQGHVREDVDLAVLAKLRIGHHEAGGHGFDPDDAHLPAAFRQSIDYS